MAAMKYETVKVADLSNDPANARKHGEKNIATIVASLRRLSTSAYLIDHIGNVALRNAVQICDLSLRLAAFASVPNRFYLLVGELCHRVLFAKVPVSMPVPILSVFRQGIPCEVAKPVVRWNTVLVSALHSRRALPNERLQNKAMNPPCKRLPILSDADVQMPRPALLWSKLSPFSTCAALKVARRPNATIIANAIPRKVIQGFVCCTHAVRIAESL
jgi:hypothetical protein